MSIEPDAVEYWLGPIIFRFQRDLFASLNNIEGSSDSYYELSREDAELLEEIYMRVSRLK